MGQKVAFVGFLSQVLKAYPNRERIASSPERILLGCGYEARLRDVKKATSESGLATSCAEVYLAHEPSIFE